VESTWRLSGTQLAYVCALSIASVESISTWLRLQHSVTFCVRLLRTNSVTFSLIFMQDRGENDIEAQLYIRQITPDNFRQYTLVAENSVSARSQDAVIRQSKSVSTLQCLDTVCLSLSGNIFVSKITWNQSHLAKAAPDDLRIHCTRSSRLYCEGSLGAFVTDRPTDRHCEHR